MSVLAQPVEHQIAQARAHRIAHHQRAGKHGNSRGDAQHHRQIRPPVVRQVAANQRRPCASVNGPAARRDQLREVAVGIAKVNARAAARPGHAALDLRRRFRRDSAPSRQGPPRESKMRNAAGPSHHAAAARRPGSGMGSSVPPFLKIRNTCRAGHAERAKAIIAYELLEPEDAPVEFGRARHVIHIDAGFQNSRDVHTFTEMPVRELPGAAETWPPAPGCASRATRMVCWLR